MTVEDANLPDEHTKHDLAYATSTAADARPPWNAATAAHLSTAVLSSANTASRPRLSPTARHGRISSCIHATVATPAGDWISPQGTTCHFSPPTILYKATALSSDARTAASIP